MECISLILGIECHGIFFGFQAWNAKQHYFDSRPGMPCNVMLIPSLESYGMLLF